MEERDRLAGYSQCIKCRKSISKRDIREHILHCGSLSLNENKTCPFCDEQLSIAQFAKHIINCKQNESSSTIDNDDDGYQTPRASTPTMIVDENCSSKRNLSSNIDDNQSTIPKKKSSKQCLLCSQVIDQTEFADHISSCSIHEQEEEIDLSQTNPKECLFCFQLFDEEDYFNHMTNCSIDDKSPENQSGENLGALENRRACDSSSKRCPLCSEVMNAWDYSNHLICCSTEDKSSSTIPKEKRITCILCAEFIAEIDYLDHVTSCSSEHTSNISEDSFPNDQRTSKTNETSTGNRKEKRDCILCFKAIDLWEYENHVCACLSQRDKSPDNKCFRCEMSLNRSDENCFREMSCPSRHCYCLKCLHKSMEEFLQSNTSPVCHRDLCDYHLSKHEISIIPLERRLSDRLMKLAKGEQRPFCSKCHFYIDLNNNEMFDEHWERCEDLIPCESCQLPFPFTQLQTHLEQCLDDPTSNEEKLTNFLLTKTKYPFSKQQIRTFIQLKSKDCSSSLDPFQLIDDLAVFGSIFPCEMCTRICEICQENCGFDDTYAFDCSDEHKVCYDCYYQSCQAKISAAELLTCPLCPLSLRDEELNQLRISEEQRKQIREYQMKKTFDVYSNRTRGIIKCPNQGCSWVAEAADPNERFQVNCPICQKEFCSLCNQQYHYRTTCQQLPQITQRWFFWCQTERRRYLTMRAEQDTSYAQQLNEYNRQTNENENRNRDLRRRYDDLMNDEQYKITHCRLCPSCGRVVERLEGCDTMICGQDAHGGNLQSGCGKGFNWQQAHPYTAAAAATKQPKQIILDLPKPENPIRHHYGIKCDHCQNEVNGIRFDCVHCPSLTFCERCEQQATLDHSKENQIFEKQQHVFKLLITPEDELF